MKRNEILQRQSYKKDYDYLTHYKNDFEKLISFISATYEIGINLISCNNHIEKTNEEILKLEQNLIHLSLMLNTQLKVFYSRWYELFYYTFGLKEININNPFKFAYEEFNIDKHAEREINDFYHGPFVITENVDSKDIKKIIQKINILNNQKIYDFMHYLDNEAIIKSKAYINQCKKSFGDDNPSLKKYWEKGGVENYLKMKDEFLPLFKGYISQFVINIENKRNKFTDYSNIFKEMDCREIAVKILNNVKFKNDIFKFFIIKEWNKYTKKLENVIKFTLFMSWKLRESKINEIKHFKESSLYTNTNWYEAYKTDYDDYKKFKFLKLFELKPYEEKR